MTWRDKLEIGLKENAPYRKDNLPVTEIQGPELPQSEGRSAEVPHARDKRPPLAGWDDEGGAMPSDRGAKAEAEQEESDGRAVRRAAFDRTHDSSARGEHRYPDMHQTEAEQQAKHERDRLKRKLGGAR